MARAKERLARLSDPEIDWQRAGVALQRALVRIQVASKAGGYVPSEHYKPPL
jgi:hypothetical protein